MSKKKTIDEPESGPNIAGAVNFTGYALTLNYAQDNLTQLLLLDIKDGVVIANEQMSDPDAPKITMAKAESTLWKIYDHVRQGQ